MTAEREVAEVCQGLYPQLVGALGLFCGDRHLAEDLAQEALARLWERWTTTRRPDHPMAWCYQVGVNLARSAARRRTIEQRILRRVGSEPRPVDSAETTIRALAVKAAILELTIRQRQAVVARHYLGLSVQETAAAMDCAPGTVTALTHQATARLRQSNLLADPDTYEEAEHGSS